MTETTRAGARRFGAFCLVGALGSVVNMALLALLHDGAHWAVVLASAVATEAAVLHNYVLNERFTFRSRLSASRLVRFNTIALGGICITVGVLTLLTTTTGMPVLMANAMAIALAMTWNFAANVRWTWRATCARAAAAVIAAAVLVLAMGVSAFAAGYSNTIPVTAPPGAFTTVLISATLNANTPADLVSGPIELQVPANALPAGTQITVFGGDQAELQALLPSGWRYVDGYAVGWLAPDGTSPPATTSLTLKLSDPAVAPNDATYSTTSTGLDPTTAASITTGSATFLFSTDPGFVIASPAAPPPVPTTGTPSAPWLVPAALFGIAGVFITSACRFRRRSR